MNESEKQIQLDERVLALEARIDELRSRQEMMQTRIDELHFQRGVVHLERTLEATEQSSRKVLFQPAYCKAPNVVISVVSFEAKPRNTVRVSASASSIETDGFLLTIGTGGHCRIQNITIEWFAWGNAGGV